VWFWNKQVEKRSTARQNNALRIAQLELQKQREQQAHEILLKQIETAARKDLNTVQVVPPTV